jgi:hypothetical protein
MFLFLGTINHVLKIHEKIEIIRRNDKVEKPAVIFSDTGFKMFLEFVKGMQDQQPKDNPVDALVKEYFAREDKPDLVGKVEEVQADTKYDMDAVANVVYELLRDNYSHEFTSDDIRTELETHGFVYSLRSIAPVMKGVMNRHPEIERAGTGIWTFVGRFRGEPNE